MSIAGGPDITTEGLVSIFDVKNNDNYVTPFSEWTMRSMSGNSENNTFSIDPSIYDPSVKSFVLDGTDETIILPKNPDTTWQWGKTISIKCKPPAGSYILNDINGLILYFTKNRKVTLLTSPHNYTYRPYVNILIDSSNNITMLGGTSNHGITIIKFDVSGNILGIKRDSASSTFCGNYAYGKIVENDGYQWVQTFRGYTKNINFLESDTRTIIGSTYTNCYQGDLDVDASFVYITGNYYDHEAYKVPKDDITSTIKFGVGEPSSGLGGLSYPRGISISTNYVFVSDTGNHRIMVLNSSDMTYYTHLGTTGISGSDPSLFNSPFTSVVKNNKLYIADNSNLRIKIYDASTLAYIESISSGVIAPANLSVNDDYIAVNDGGANTNVNIIRLSDSSIVLSKTFISSYEFGGFYRYGAKGMRCYNNEVISFDRNITRIIIDSENLTTGNRVNHGGADSLDLAIDSSYYYMTIYLASGIQKLDKNTNTKVAESIIDGSANGEWAASCHGIDIDSSYLYVADTGNNRIQIVDCSDLSYYTQFGTYGSEDDGAHFDAPYTVTIDSSKLYVGDYNNYKIRVYDITDVSAISYIDSYSCNISPEKIRVWEDELFIKNGVNIRVYDISTFDLKRSKTLTTGNWIDNVGTSSSFEVYGDKLFYQSGYQGSILDKETLEVEMILSPWYKCALVDTVISEEDLFIDIIFTEDYKIKVFANGNASYVIDSCINYEYQSSADIILGNLRTDYSAVEYDWFAFYNREKTLEEHTKDYINLKPRIL